jgi:hypothetical protein
MFRNLSTLVLIIIAACMALSAMVTYVVVVPPGTPAAQPPKCPPETAQTVPKGKLGTIIGNEQRY